MSLPNGGSFRRSSSGRHEREKTTRRKGLVGASGLGLDHAEIPMIEKQVYAVLEPLVQRLDEPIPLSQFSQSACDALLPVLPKRRPLTDHEFKSQWGRLNEFVAPKLAAMKGWGDSGYSREEKTVRLAIAVPSGAGVALATPATAAPAPAASTARQKGGAGGPGGPAAGAGAGAGAAAAPVAAAGSAEGTAGLGAAGPGGGEAAPQAPRAPGGPCPVALGAGPEQVWGWQPPPPPPPTATPSPGTSHSLSPGPSPGSSRPITPPQPLCSYCHSPHPMKHCSDFHLLLQSIYQAGFQHGAAAIQQMPPAAYHHGPPHMCAPPY